MCSQIILPFPELQWHAEYLPLHSPETFPLGLSQVNAAAASHDGCSLPWAQYRISIREGTRQAEQAPKYAQKMRFWSLNFREQNELNECFSAQVAHEGPGLLWTEFSAFQSSPVAVRCSHGWEEPPVLSWLRAQLLILFRQVLSLSKVDLTVFPSAWTWGFLYCSLNSTLHTTVCCWSQWWGCV